MFCYLQICCPNEFLSRVPTHKQGDQYFNDDYDRHGSLERGTSGKDDHSDEYDEDPEPIHKGSSADKRYPQADDRNPPGSASGNGRGHENGPEDILQGNRVTKNPSPISVIGHKNFHLLPSKCGHIGIRNRIFNGNKTGIFEFPWMTLIAYNKSKD